MPVLKSQASFTLVKHHVLFDRQSRGTTAGGGEKVGGEGPRGEWVTRTWLEACTSLGKTRHTAELANP